MSDPRMVIVSTLSEAREACREYQESWDLGGGNWGRECGEVIDAYGKEVARFSYNLRCWSPDGGQEMRVR